MPFNEQLMALRRAKNISQEALAEKLGVSRQAVSKWETGTAKPELDNILALCRILEVTPNELLGDAEPVPALEEMPVVSKGSSAPRKTPMRNIVIYCCCLIFLILFGLGVKWGEDRGKAPRIESCVVHETRALDNAREFTLKITYSFLPEDQTNNVFIHVSPHVQDIYRPDHEVTINGKIGYVTFLLPYGAECTVQHDSKAKKMLYVQDILKITLCTKEDYQQEFLIH